MESSVKRLHISQRIFYIIVFSCVIILSVVIVTLKEITDRTNPETVQKKKLQSVYQLETSYVPPVYDENNIALSFGNGILKAQEYMKDGKKEEAKRILFILSLYYPDSIVIENLQKDLMEKEKTPNE